MSFAARARSQPAALLGLLAVAGIAWWVTANRMVGMDAGPGTALDGLGWFVGVWTVMMAAMMLPSLAPTAAGYAATRHEHHPGLWVGFAAGYLLVWTGAGVAAYGLFELGRSLLASQLAWHSGGQWVAGGVLALAALYELTPVKTRCLERCRASAERVTGGSHRRRADAVAQGIHNGLWCVGCSWALMAALFALGVMSLTWMAVMAAILAVEKVAPWPRLGAAIGAGLLALLAVGVLAAPHDVPGLVVPGNASRAMKAMGARPSAGAPALARVLISPRA